MKKILLILIISILSFGNTFSEEFVCVVNKSNSPTISSATLKRILLGKMNNWDNGNKVVIVNVGVASEDLDKLLQDVCGKSPVEFKEHWTKMQIQGKGTAPMIQQSTDGAKAMVGNIPGGITFIEKSKVDGNVVELKVE